MKTVFRTQNYQIIDLCDSLPFWSELRDEKFEIFCGEKDKIRKIGEFKTRFGANSYLNRIYKKLSGEKDED